MAKQSPYQILQKYTGERIEIRLKDSEYYKGLLLGVEKSKHDGLGNIVLRDVKKINSYEENFDWILIRGNNILFIYLGES